MTITKENLAAKLVVGFVAVSMLFTLSFSPAKAATEAELQAQITALLAQIQSLQGQLGQGGSTTTGGSCAPFTMDLTMGASGADVTALQNFLIGKGHAIAAGATGYFGAQTQAALAAFQTANGISPAAGYFGPITRAKVNTMCEASASDDDANDDDANDDDSSSDELSGEASLDDVEMNDGDDTDLEEGQEDAPIAEMEVEFVDGDARISRIDLAFVSTSASEEDPWDTFEDVSLWVDGDEVARVNADDEDEYLDEDDGSLRIAGLDIVAMEDEPVTIVIAATVQSSVDNMPANWRVDADALRFFDADDVATTETGTGDLGDNGVAFTIEQEGADDEVIVKASSEDPDSTTFKIEENEKSDWYTIFAFDLDTDDSVNDVEVNELEINLYSASGTAIANMVSDMQLVIDGETYDDYTMTAGPAGVASSTFDIDGDLVVEAGERVTVEVQVEFKALSGNYAEGETIKASTTGALGDFEGVDEIIGEGSAEGDTHTIRSTGVILEPNTMSETFKENNDATTTDNEGVFVVKFDVTAFEDDVYIAKSAFQGTTLGTAGANFRILDASNSGAVVTTGATSTSLTSTADTESNYYKVAEGETETFTLTVEYDPASGSFYQVELYSVNFKAGAASAPDKQQLALPSEDYQTDSLSVDN